MTAATLDRRWGEWLIRRALEVLIYLLALLGIWMAHDDYVPVESVFTTAAAFAFVYGLYFLYYPLSMVLWLVSGQLARGALRKNFDSALYFLHSYISVSIMQNGLIGITQVLDLTSPVITTWLAVVGLHVCLIARSFRVRK